jgi:hypothetical protein
MPPFGRRIHLVLPRKTQARLNQGKELLLTLLGDGLAYVGFWNWDEMRFSLNLEP